jgi:hypothetical protein
MVYGGWRGGGEEGRRGGGGEEVKEGGRREGVVTPCEPESR